MLVRMHGLDQQNVAAVLKGNIQVPQDCLRAFPAFQDHFRLLLEQIAVSCVFCAGLEPILLSLGLWILVVVETVLLERILQSKGLHPPQVAQTVALENSQLLKEHPFPASAPSAQLVRIPHQALHSVSTAQRVTFHQPLALQLQHEIPQFVRFAKVEPSATYQEQPNVEIAQLDLILRWR